MWTEQVERGIFIKNSYENGTIYLLRLRHDGNEKWEKYLSLEVAQEARRHYDQSKNQWTSIGINGQKMNFIKEITVQDEITGLWYVKRIYNNDILVSHLYPKNEIKKIKKFLDDKNWSISALNQESQQGIQSTNKYNFILPTREGYIIQNKEHKQFGSFKDLEEAYQKKEELIRDGVL